MDSLNWFDSARAYADWVDEQRQYTPFPVSEACYYPMYDLWYWAYDNTNKGLYWTTLVQAEELGFKSYLFDAGWESHAGEFSKWLEGPIGNYFHPEDKLPGFAGFAGFVQYVKERLRMNVVFWLSPYALGRQSVYYPSVRHCHTLLSRSRTEYSGGIDEAPMTLPYGRRYDQNTNLCSRHPDTRQYLKTLFERVSGSYAPDGYWLDFQETIPFRCDARHLHDGDFGKGFNAAQETIKQTILERNQEATVELRFPVPT
jgi:hypothetical protein